MEFRSDAATPVYAIVPISSATRRVGTMISGLAIVFLLLDTAGRLVRSAAGVDGLAQQAHPDCAVRLIGIVLLICVALYSMPPTAVLGAILLTGYLGAAVGADFPLLKHMLLPIYIAALLWGGLFLREERLRALLPLRR